jgi:hypothetical protein
MHDVDPAGVHPGADHGVSHRARYRDEPRDSLTVLETDRFRCKCNPARHDQGNFLAPDQRDHRQCVRPGIVRVNEIDVPRLHSSPDLSRGTDIPVSAHFDCRDSQSCSAGSLDERGFRGPYQKWLMATLA